MQIDGAITTLSARLDQGYRSAATPPTTNQLIDSVNTRPSAEFQQSFKVSDFTPDAAEQVDIQA